MSSIFNGSPKIVSYQVTEPVVFGSNPPDDAPTGILYVFDAAKSNSLNTYNKDGSLRQNVGVGDAFKFFNLRWTYQFTFGHAQLTGLAQVHHDGTLTGTGESSNLLKVAKPAAEAGAEVNPKHVIKFSGIDGEIVSLNPYKIGFYDGDTQVQSGSITEADTLYIAEQMGTFGASDPTLSPEVPMEKMFGDRSANGGSVVLALRKHGSSEVQYIQSETISRYTDASNRPGYKLINLTWVGDYTFDTGAGSNWDIVAGNTIKFTKDIVNIALEYAKLDGTNLSAAFRRSVQRFNEEIDLTGTYQRISSLSVPTAGQWTINSTPTLTAPAQIQFAPKTADVTPFSLGIAAGTYIDLSATCTVEVTHDSISVANNLWTFRVTLVKGTLPAENASNEIHLEGADIHRTEIAPQAFKNRTPNIQGDGGKKSQAYSLNANGEIEWLDFVPSDLVFSELFNRTSVGAGNYTDANGQLLLSDGNAAPSDAPGATSFILINHNDASGTDQSSEIQAVKVGEWMFVRVADTFVSARVQYIDKVVDQSGTRFWVIPDETSKHTHSYDTLASGTANVGFTNLIPDLNDLVEGTPTDGQIIAWNATHNRAEWEDKS